MFPSKHVGGRPDDVVRDGKREVEVVEIDTADGAECVDRVACGYGGGVSMNVLLELDDISGALDEVKTLLELGALV